MAWPNINSIWMRLDLLQDIDDLNKNIGKSIYLLFENDTIVGTSRKSDMDIYLKEENVLERYEDDVDSIDMLYGLILDPTSLPMTISKMDRDYKFYVIFPGNGVATIDFSDEDSLEAVTECIEEKLEACKWMNINNIAVMYACPIRLMLQTMSVAQLINQDIRKEFIIDG